MSDVLIDTHTHYFHKRFDSGRDEIINGLIDLNVIAVIEAAIDFGSNQKMKSLCEKYPHVYMATGCHPNCIEEMDEEKYQEIEELSSYGKVVAIGETGLDYSREKSETKRKRQKEWFRKFIMLSIEKQKPLVIHCREAYDEIIEILQEYRFMEKPGVIHCFNGNQEQARVLADMGFYIGVNGMFTKMPANSAMCETLKNTPLERVLFETDSPYLLPLGVKGKRNTSANLNTIVNKYAELRGEEPEHVGRVVLNNTQRLFSSIF